MPSQDFRYFFDMSRAKGDGSLGQFEGEVDLEPVAEWGRFAALRQWVDPALAAEAEIRIAPIWHATAGAPYVEGLRVTARADAAPAVTADIPTSYFKSSAMRIGDALVSLKKLESGELFTYAVLAYPAAEARGNESPDALEIEDIPVPATLSAGSIDTEIERSIAFGDLGSGLLPVFVPQGVIDEVMALTEQADTVEVGAVLIGKMHRDARSRELFMKVTGQIPARHTLSESTKVSFTAETWAAVQAALDLRRSGEQMVGWFHNHPARHWCNKDCLPEAKLQCPFTKPFFSSADCDLHRVAFCSPHCIALLVTNTFSGMKITMYGWDRALIIQRGFHIAKPDVARPLPVAEATSIIGADIHETSCHS
jgi:proteasome lid subunit RPN8/RPN11